MFTRSRPSIKTPATPDELTVLLADFTARQQEIVDRGRSENYLYVIFFTAIGVLVTATALFFAHPLTELPPFLPTLLLVGAVVLLCLPINQIHLGTVTELRRIYVQDNLEPRLRELAGHAGHSGSGHATGVFSFESFDRAQHHGPFNFTIGVRSAYMALPSALLIALYVCFRAQLWATLTPLLWCSEIVLWAIILFIAFVVISSFVRLWKLIAAAQRRADTRV